MSRHNPSLEDLLYGQAQLLASALNRGSSFFRLLWTPEIFNGRVSLHCLQHLLWLQTSGIAVLARGTMHLEHVLTALIAFSQSGSFGSSHRLWFGHHGIKCAGIFRLQHFCQLTKLELWDSRHGYATTLTSSEARALSRLQQLQCLVRNSSASVTFAAST